MLALVNRFLRLEEQGYRVGSWKVGFLEDWSITRSAGTPDTFAKILASSQRRSTRCNAICERTSHPISLSDVNSAIVPITRTI